MDPQVIDQYEQAGEAWEGDETGVGCCGLAGLMANSWDEIWRARSE
jgi:hypothetical protein